MNPDGSIKQFPSQPGKIKVILEYIINAFEPGQTYAEKEAINLLLARFNKDTSTLRRYLIDADARPWSGRLRIRGRDEARNWSLFSRPWPVEDCRVAQCPERGIAGRPKPRPSPITSPGWPRPGWSMPGADGYYSVYQLAPGGSPGLRPQPFF